MKKTRSKGITINNTDKILEIMLKNSVDIGKLTEVSIRTSNDVAKLIKLHAKSDKLETTAAELITRVDRLEKDRKSIDIIFVLFKHKALTIILLIASYILAVQELRDVFSGILPLLKIIGI